MPSARTSQRRFPGRSGSVSVLGSATLKTLRLFSFNVVGAGMLGVGWEKGFASVQHLVAAVLNIDYPIY